MANCSICGTTVHCGNGCGILCTSDCDFCSVWCEPTTLSARIEGVMTRVNRKTGDLQIGVGETVELPDADIPSYSDQEELRVCFQDLPRASLAHLLGNNLRRAVRAAAGKEDERISGSDEGTVAELAAKYSLIVE